MNTAPNWHARRKGRAVTIHGFVLTPTDATPIFDRIPEPRPDTRSYRFYWNPIRHPDAQTGFMSWVEHTERDMPEHIRTLRITLPDGTIVRIGSQQPAAEPLTVRTRDRPRL